MAAPMDTLTATAADRTATQMAIPTMQAVMAAVVVTKCPTWAQA